MSHSQTIMAVLLLMLTLPACVCCQEIRWQRDLNAAQATAKEKNCPIMLDFGAEACVWCKQLDVKTFRDPAVAKLLADRFVVVKIDANKDAALAQSLGVHALPTLIFKAPDGKVIGRHEGYIDAPEFRSRLLALLAQDKQGPLAGLQPKIRMQAPEEQPLPLATHPITLKSPEQLGIALAQHRPALPTDAPVDYDSLFARMRQLRASGFRLERTASGYRARIDLPDSANRIASVEGLGPNEATALTNALAKIDATRDN